MRAAVKGVSISEALADAYASAPDDLILLETLELRHATFVEAGKPFSIYIVNNNEDITAVLEPQGSPVYVDISAPLNCGISQAVGVTVTGLDPLTEYDVTLPPGRTHTAWSGYPSGPQWHSQLTYIGNDGGGVMTGIGPAVFDHVTAEAARIAFPSGNTITGHSSYTFWMHDNNPSDNRGGLSVCLSPLGKEVVFRRCGFTLRRPKESGSGEAAELQVQVNNVSLYLMPYLLAAKGTRQPVYVTWRPYAANDLTGPHMLPVLTATMKNVKCGVASVSGVASFSDSVNLRFPTLEYTGRLHPALTAR